MDVLTLACSREGQNGQESWNFCGNHNQAWCAAFVSTMLHKAGEGAVIGNRKMTAVQEYLDYFTNIKAFAPMGSYKPQPGDIIIWKKGHNALSMGSHVGLVLGCDADGTIHTVEGNRGGKGSLRNTVGLYTYRRGEKLYKDISGFGIPRYANAPAGGGNYSSIGSYDGMSSMGEEGYTAGKGLKIGVYDYTPYTVKTGDTLESIAAAKKVSVDLILAYNDINRWEPLDAGTTLNIPSITNAVNLQWNADSFTPIEEAHTQTTKVYHPVINAEFYTEGGALAATALGLEHQVFGDADLDFDIISCTTQRSLAADCPTMSITLTNRRDWYNILSSNDLVIIRMRRPEFGEDAAEYDEPEQEVFIGVIDDIRKSLDFSSGQPKRAIQVTARGLGKAFVNFSIGLIKNIAVDMGTGFMGERTIPAGSGVLDSPGDTEEQTVLTDGTTDPNTVSENPGTDGSMLSMTGMNSAQAIRYVWDTYVGSVIRYTFYNGKTLSDYLEYSGQLHQYECLTDFKSYTQYTGSLWNFIKELTNPPFNETFWEILDHDPADPEKKYDGRKAVLVHRPSPFNPEDWNALKRITIRDDDIVTDATGRSDLETYTLFIVNLRHMGENMSQYYNPLWYRPHYEKYGISQLEVTSTYEVPGSIDVDAVRYYGTELFNWNIKNNVFANGQVVVKGRASYKVGQRVAIEYSGLEFYVEGVSHNFTVYGGWTTTLSLTRGIEPEERFTAPWGMAQEMTPDVMRKIIQLAEGKEVDWMSVEESTEEGYAVNGGSVSGGGGSFSGNTDSSGGSITIPGNVQQCGIIPDDITNYAKENWAYDQKRVFDLWQKAGRPSSGGIATLNGRYLVAMREGTIGSTGDIVDIHLEGGAVIPAILADEKGNDCNSAWGHMQSYAASGVSVRGISLVEFERVGTGAQVLQELRNKGWYLKKVVSVSKVGKLLGRG